MRTIKRRLDELERSQADAPERLVMRAALDVGDGIPRDPQTRDPLPEDPDRIIIRPVRGELWTG